MKSVAALLILLLSATFAYADGDLIVTGKLGVGSTTSPSNTLDIAGTTRFADGATWGPSGIADTSIYTTVNTPIIDFSNTYNFSSTANFSAMQFKPKLVPTGPSAGAMNAVVVTGNVDSSSIDMTQMRSLNVNSIVSAGYSGTIGSYSGLLVNQLANNGTKRVNTSYGIYVNGTTTNGNTITSGTVSNYGIFATGSSAAAGTGGVVKNYTASLTLPTGSSSTTTNYGLRITGNGGVAPTNYGIYNDSTAANYFAGNVGLGTSSLSSGNSALVFGAGTKPSAGAGLYGTHDVNNQMILKVFDENGNDNQVTAHAQDAPDWLYDVDDGLPMIVKETQHFLGYVRYTNQTRAARLAAMTDAEKQQLPSTQRTCIAKETFAEHEARTGEKLTRLIWEEEQAKIKQTLDAQRQAIIDAKAQLTAQMVTKSKQIAGAQGDTRISLQQESAQLQGDLDSMQIPDEYVIQPTPPRLQAALGR